ncbi:hypothetical protein GCM10010343_11660 [Streptomyces avidinii]|uniref:Uncharacterized protein YbjT (DUF2867 family) n=1 Tax=Streptomyces avidinii TaxID=1895 RepID=A0ABS4KXE6_STRAV|nr:uncharacterized protein YbjT (DUF2867 family) [Streptomyces avidinii]GGY88177.1 hypothetical protein GCM10010343_11660 [Streptomyces avidinii]
MITVTGATGNVGRPLTQALAAAGEQVTAVSRHAAAVPNGVRHRLLGTSAIRPTSFCGSPVAGDGSV